MHEPANIKQDCTLKRLQIRKKAMPQQFTWVPLYCELADRLSEWEARQGELIEFLKKLRKDGCVISSLMDQDPPGTKFLLQEIDPFTFFATFNRGITEENRRAILARMKNHFCAKSDLPSDFAGIPLVNLQSSWFIAYRFRRDPNDVPRLWRVFRLALRADPLNDPEFWAAFDEALKVRRTKFNLTMGLFWIRPDMFLNLDQTNRTHLNISLPPSGLNAAFYRETIATIRNSGKSFLEISHEAWQQQKPKQVHRADGTVGVTVPKDEPETNASSTKPGRESIKYQADLAKLGEKMGFRIWLPRNDRGAVLQHWQPADGVLLDILPLNYDDVTLQTIEHIDVLWLKGRAIQRAFEVEHSTAIYSGLLRMADLLALQPNMNIALHIVAPGERRDKVLSEIRRPVFSLLENQPLARRCTFIAYENLCEIMSFDFLGHLSDSVLEEYAEVADE